MVGLQRPAGELVLGATSVFVAEEYYLVSPISHAVSCGSSISLPPHHALAGVAELTLASMEHYITLVIHSRMRISADTIDGPIASNSPVSSARRAAADILPLDTVNLETVIRLHYLQHSFEYYQDPRKAFLTTMGHIDKVSRVAGSADSLEANFHEHLHSALVPCWKGLKYQGKQANITSMICRLLLDRQLPENLNLLGAHTGMGSLDDRSVLWSAIA